jgi:dipeptidase E
LFHQINTVKITAYSLNLEKIMKLLLLSSSRVDNTDYLEHAAINIKQHLGNSITEVLFIPYAGVALSYDAYESKVSQAFSQLGYEIRSIHQYDDPIKALEEAQAIAVGGGNTFCLLNSLYENNLLTSIRAKVRSGTPYIGWSAGSNIASPSICTTNDMPIIEPPSFKALSLLPFQLNPHYIDGNPPGHNGETREMRINEYMMINSKQTVIGLPEGTALKLANGKLSYLGEKAGFKFTQAQGKQPIAADADLSHLLLE